jgi:histidinol dehydrogenase
MPPADVVYAARSRRSGGLSIGVNLFTARKVCQFDCAYCEVFPAASAADWTLADLAAGLRGRIAAAAADGEAVKDICFSGNGEPTLSPRFGAALALAAAIRAEAAPGASLVLITNGAGLVDPESRAGLAAAAAPPPAGIGLDIWIKLDAGTEAWYRRIDRSGLDFGRLQAGIAAFLAAAPAAVQTMLCAVGGSPPPAEETAAYLARAVELASGGRISRFQLYGKARPAPEDPLAEALPRSALDERAVALSAALASAGLAVPVETYY